MNISDDLNKTIIILKQNIKILEDKLYKNEDITNSSIRREIWCTSALRQISTNKCHNFIGCSELDYIESEWCCSCIAKKYIRKIDSDEYI